MGQYVVVVVVVALGKALATRIILSILPVKFAASVIKTNGLTRLWTACGRSTRVH
jgi:hypothetical protein